MLWSFSDAIHSTIRALEPLRCDPVGNSGFGASQTQNILQLGLWSLSDAIQSEISAIKHRLRVLKAFTFKAFKGFKAFLKA